MANELVDIKPTRVSREAFEKVCRELKSKAELVKAGQEDFTVVEAVLWIILVDSGLL